MRDSFGGKTILHEGGERKMANPKNDSWNDKKRNEKDTKDQNTTKNRDDKTKPCKNSVPV
jgi:hypothetical protein